MKTKLLRYWSYQWVMVLDLCLSLVATAVSYLLVAYFIPLNLTATQFTGWMVIALVSSLIAFYAFRTHHSVIRHMRLHDMWKNGGAVLTKAILVGGALTYWSSWMSDFFPSTGSLFICLLLDFLLTILLTIAVRVILLICYEYVQMLNRKNALRTPVLIYGVHERAISILSYLQSMPQYHVVGFLTYGTKMRKQKLAGKPIYYFLDNTSIEKLSLSRGIKAVVFADYDEIKVEDKRLIKYCTEQHLRILTAHGIDTIEDTQKVKQKHDIREIKIEDLLGRKEIKISMAEIINNFKGKTVMVTGCAGSIGSELCRQLAGFGVKELILFDNAETPMHYLRLELEENYPNLKFTPIIGDVRIPKRLNYAFEKYHPKVLFHAAAYKHVPLMEENPCESILVNVVGSRNVADCCLRYDVEQMVMISTDKAVNPTNIMGCSKRLAEIYIQSLGQAIENGFVAGKTKFVTTRFGNVLGSNGSVIPRFREQIAKGGPVTVTHPEITRFFMTIPEACLLVMEAATMASSNQIFVFDMGESVKISTLAKRMIELAGYTVGKEINIEYTGLRPGEKLYEEVLATNENTQATNHEKIRIAQVREYDYQQAVLAVEDLDKCARTMNVTTMVQLMKTIVPEFKSMNSRFSEFDDK